MVQLNIRRMGLALGLTSALFYLGCVLVTLTVSREAVIRFFNSVLHGLDVTAIIRTNVPAGELFIGIIETFIIGWLVGATVASIYNFGVEKPAKD